jgi:hypothetical protein
VERWWRRGCVEGPSAHDLRSVHVGDSLHHERQAIDFNGYVAHLVYRRFVFVHKLVEEWAEAEAGAKRWQIIQVRMHVGHALSLLARGLARALSPSLFALLLSPCRGHPLERSATVATARTARLSAPDTGSAL